MSNPLAPEHQELMAGYVLGDLSPEEQAQVQALLEQNSSLAGEVRSLQEALDLIPLGLALESPPATLRTQLLASVAPQASKPVKLRRRSLPGLRWASICAVGLAIALGFQNWQLRQQLAMRPSENGSILSAQGLPQGWQGFAEILADHRNSLTRSQGPVDFATQDVAQVRSEYAQRMVLPSQLPQLVQAQLLGGSFCELEHTRGIRLSYQVSTGETVSFYQLLRSQSLPQTNGVEMTLKIKQGPNFVVWETSDYVFALVGEIPVPDLWQLAPQRSSISSLR